MSLKTLKQKAKTAGSMDQREFEGDNRICWAPIRAETNRPREAACALPRLTEGLEKVEFGFAGGWVLLEGGAGRRVRPGGRGTSEGGGGAQVVSIHKGTGSSRPAPPTDVSSGRQL